MTRHVPFIVIDALEHVAVELVLNEKDPDKRRYYEVQRDALQIVFNAVRRNDPTCAMDALVSAIALMGVLAGDARELRGALHLAYDGQVRHWEQGLMDVERAL